MYHLIICAEMVQFCLWALHPAIHPYHNPAAFFPVFSRHGTNFNDGMQSSSVICF